MLELRHISKNYEGHPLLTDISFAVSHDETICLLGASGSGKSTLLRMIAGLEPPDNGLILFNGMDLAATPPHVRDFGLVFQDYGLFPHLNVFDNVAFGLRMKGSFKHKGHEEKIRERVLELLKQVNLSGFEKRKVTDLSGGEQQRVALARALAPRPRLLMFDEPLGALDRNLKEDLLNEIRSILHQAKITAIYVTHDQEEAFAIADRILLLHAGRIAQQGAPEAVYEHPNSAWVAKFLNAGNVVEGRMNAAREGGSAKVETEFGMFNMDCRHAHAVGDKVQLLLKQLPSPEGGRAGDEGHVLNLKVEDVLFKREQFEVRGRGGLVFLTEAKPKVGQSIEVRVAVECLG